VVRSSATGGDQVRTRIRTRSCRLEGQQQPPRAAPCMTCRPGGRPQEVAVPTLSFRFVSRGLHGRRQPSIVPECGADAKPLGTTSRRGHDRPAHEKSRRRLRDQRGCMVGVRLCAISHGARVGQRSLTTETASDRVKRCGRNASGDQPVPEPVRRPRDQPRSGVAYQRQQHDHHCVCPRHSPRILASRRRVLAWASVLSPEAASDS
jgi:hypothetical protein